MTTGIIICSIITLLGIILMIIGKFKFSSYDYKETCTIIGLVINIFCGTFGWGLANSTTTHKTEKIPLEYNNIEIVKTDVSVIVIFNGKNTYIYDSHQDYKNINENSKWFVINEYNQYNILIDTSSPFYENDNNNTKKEEKKENEEISRTITY